MTGESCKISVIVPVYNKEAYLRECVDSILSQDYQNMEVILVDDASTDNGATRDLIVDYEQRFPDTIMAVFLEQNLRQGGARNVGVSYAGGEYLTFCDADDWILKETLEHCYRAAKEYNADVVEFNRINVGERDISVELEQVMAVI